MMGADGDHQLGQLNALVHGLHKGTGAGGHIQQDGIGAGGQLLGHDGRGDQRDAADRGGHIPQGVHLLIRHGNALALANDRQPDLVHLGKELLLRKGSSGAGHALHFINGAAGMAQTAATHLGNLYTAGRHHRGDHKGSLIAHAAGGVLIHLDAGDGGKIDHHAAVGHHVRQLGCFFVGHAAQVDRHHPGSHLVIGHFSADKAVDNGLQLFPGVGTAIALFRDQIINTHRNSPV